MIPLLLMPFLIAAAVLGIRGWVTNQPDSASRFRDRYLATGIMFCVTLVWLTQAWVHHSWFWVVFDGLAAFAWMERTRHWWREWEAYRQRERLLAELSSRRWHDADMRSARHAKA